eukprot:TRINITY_DN1029_c0_g1_i1.p1 TRINITY_DN1029_c0_g1~~TRINITY_DN1029_c0_g1_i1.p1  ORF type:complete len:436 (-),score=83.86 TRINITY_DN1029_c0_g1_i1:8-1264(-)
MPQAAQQLTAHEEDLVKRIYDHSGGMTGFVKIRQVLSSCGQNLTDSEVAQLLAQVNYSEGHILPLASFFQIMLILKQQHTESEDTDTGDAFVALGGNRDKSGQVDANQLREAVRLFELTIDIEKLLSDVDSDGSGLIEFSEFASMLENGTANERKENSSGSTSSLLPKKPKEPEDAAFAGGWWQVAYKVSVAPPPAIHRISSLSIPSDDEETDIASSTEEDAMPPPQPSVLPAIRKKTAAPVVRSAHKSNFLTSGVNRKSPTEVFEQEEAPHADTVHHLGHLPAYLRQRQASLPKPSRQKTSNSIAGHAVEPHLMKHIGIAGPLQQPHGMAEQFASHSAEELGHLLPLLDKSVLRTVTADHFTASIAVPSRSPTKRSKRENSPASYLAEEVSVTEFLPPFPGKCNVYTVEEKLARWTA